MTPVRASGSDGPVRRGLRAATPERLATRVSVVAVVVGVAAASVVGLAGPAAGDDQAKLDQLRARQQQVKVQLNLAVANDTAVQAEAGRLARLVISEQALVVAARSSVDAAQQRVQEATRRIDDLTSRGTAAHDALLNRAIDLYEHPFRNEQLVLDGVRSLDELTTRQVLANTVQARTSDLLDAVRQQRAQEVTARKDLAAAQTEAEHRRQRAEDEQARLDAALASEQKAHTELQSRIHDLDVENTGLAAQEAPLQAKLAAAAQRYAAEIAAARAASAAAAAAAPPAIAGPSPGSQSGATGSYGLQWPLSGPVTREFGYQPGGFHPGIDIAPGYGSPIYASGDGVVIYAGWEQGYGNYTCIDHGRNVSSCYGHQSEIDVAVGQTVRRGSFIGREGSTGNSTGPHVHFEIRVGGEVNNPRDFIPGSP